MVSEGCRKITWWFWQVGSYLGLFPIVWDSVNMPIRIKHGSRIYLPGSSLGYIDTSKIVPGILFLIQIFHFLYLVSYIIFFDYSIVDMCLALVFIVGFFMAISSQWTLFFYLNEFCNFLDSFFQQDLNMRKSIKQLPAYFEIISWIKSLLHFAANNLYHSSLFDEKLPNWRARSVKVWMEREEWLNNEVGANGRL